MLKKSGELKTTFFNFIGSLSLPISKISNMLAYSFLIPIIPELYEFAQGHSGIDVGDLIKRILFYLGLSTLGVSIKRIINNIVERFKS
jgi:hypothetical protein